MSHTQPVPDLIRRRSPDQVAFLVEDIEDAMPNWVDHDVADRQWRRYVYDQDFLADSTYRESPGEFSMRLALLGSGPQIELIEPISGPSIYHEWIAERGYGFHHFGYFVESLASSVAEFEAAGFPSLQAGSGYGLQGDGGFAYFDFSAELGAWVELIEVPAQRKPALPSF